jgi:hypothetical protein
VHTRTRPRRTIGAAVFRPPRALGVIVGGGIVLWALAIGGLSLWVAVGAPAEFKTFAAWVAGALLLFLAMVFLNWTYSLATLRYTIGDDALVIVWGFRRIVVPIQNIQRMVPGRTLDEPDVEGLNWWGCHVGAADVPRIGYTLFYSTHSSPDELLYVVTDGEAYALTVLDQASFAEEVQARAALGPVLGATQRASATGLAALPFWRDRVALMAAALSILACAGLVGYVFTSYPGLPQVVQFEFPDLGGIVRIGNKAELLRIAYLGAGILATNVVLGVLVHARERAAGLWLFVSAGMIQVVLLSAALVAFENA